MSRHYHDEYCTHEADALEEIADTLNQLLKLMQHYFPEPEVIHVDEPKDREAD